MSSYLLGLTNAALRKVATQFSDYNSNNPASLSVDGSMVCDEIVEVGVSITNPGAGATAWWMVDLGYAFKISSIYITGRSASWAIQSSDLEVRVGNDGANGGYGNPVCASNVNAAGRTIAAPCAAVGRFVTIDRMTSSYLSLCEVQVMSVPSGKQYRMERLRS